MPTMKRPMVDRRTFLAVTPLLTGSCALAPRAEPLDASLREEFTRLPVAGSDGSIVVTRYRPPGPGPFPWIVLSHGTAPDAAANREIGRWRNLHLVRQWVGRGYAVVVPVRRGYGASGGTRLGDGYGSCARPDFDAAGRAAAADLDTARAWALSHADMDPGRWMLVGQSAGGFASIAAAAAQPPGLRAVLAFSPGRGGDPVARPGQPCASAQLGELFARLAPRVRVPVLWFYAQNDAYIGPDTQRLWFGRFRDAGGRGELVVVPPFPHRLGHGVFTSPEGTPLWTAAVARFLSSQAIALSFPNPT